MFSITRDYFYRDNLSRRSIWVTLSFTMFVLRPPAAARLAVRMPCRNRIHYTVGQRMALPLPRIGSISLSQSYSSTASPAGTTWGFIGLGQMGESNTAVHSLNLVAGVSISIRLSSCVSLFGLRLTKIGDDA